MKSKAVQPSPSGISGLATAARGLRLKQSLPIAGFGKLLLRAITPEDEPLLIEFHQALSEETVYKRYFEHINLESRTKHDRLLRVCTNSDETFALVAEYPGAPKKPKAIFAIGRLSKSDHSDAADFALLVHDKVQGHGIGSAMMKRLSKLARVCGFRRLIGEVLVANHEMLYVCRQFGFSVHLIPDDGLVQVSLDL